MDKDTALRLALEALESHLVWFSRDTMIGKSMRDKTDQAITAIKAALKAKDEPDYKALWQQMCERCDELDKKLAQRKPLTNEEIQQIFIANSVVVDNGNAYMVAGLRTVNIARAIEAKLKEKNT